MWNNAWFITKHELKRSNWGKLASVILYLYFGVFSAFIVGAMYAEASGGMRSGISIPADIVFLTAMCCIGFSMTADYVSFYKTDIFTRKLQYMRQLPIGPSELVTARYLQIAITTVAQSLLFFIPFYFISDMGYLLTPAQFVAFALIWIFFGICVCLAFTYMELGLSGKVYFLFNMIVVFILVAAASTAGYFGISLVDLTVRGAATFGVWMSLAGLVIAILSGCVWFRLTERKIRSRSFIK
ncbi:hypothetical protein [Paenibacillus ginsengarvi]|uniref:ABC transporter permease n=1 Tax=Paenibacillus ginsengarvi TaxID=400777 RepID=A0A3B0ALB7_9BACL|nr:hypothetical protein [Paenibacillus ginsengarvi]RKN61400.1 hypothetical protein D7M11_35425 [Paenibacillus ginsengarvi]